MGTSRPDKGLWQAMLNNQYRFDSCSRERKTCLLMSLDLNGDGKPEAVIYQFSDRTIVVYTQTRTGWKLAGDTWKMPDGLSREELERAVQQGKVKPVVKPWADIQIFSERVEINYDNALVR